MALRNISTQTFSLLAFAGIALVLSANTLRPEINGRLKKNWHMEKRAAPHLLPDTIPVSEPQ